MNYMGSKTKYAKYIVPILQKTINENNVDIYIEPFVGGANIIDKIKCKNRYGFDRNERLIALLQTAAIDYDKILKSGSKDFWDKAKEFAKTGKNPDNLSLADCGAIEFFQSMSAGGFVKGYIGNTKNRNFFQERYNNLKKQAPNLKDIIFKAQNYWELDKNIKNAVIYCDPPYEGTARYGWAKDKIDYAHYWNWVREISKNNFVFISEQKAPSDFECIWKQEVKRSIDFKKTKKATEKLFIIKKV